MNPPPDDPEETNLSTLAGAFPYPPTPDIARSVRLRLEKQAYPRQTARLAWAAAILVVILIALLGVPPVRAQLLEWLQIGVVRIFSGEKTPTPPPLTTPAPTPTLLPSLLELDGETSLEAARRQVEFPILLPSYPPELGLPDYVFLQELDTPFLFLVWTDSHDSGSVRLSLQIIPPGSMAIDKWQPTHLLETKVNENPAAWVTGSYLLRLSDGDLEMRRMIEGNVLVWQENEITYRLETSLSLEEAVKIAQSIK